MRGRKVVDKEKEIKIEGEMERRDEREIRLVESIREGRRGGRKGGREGGRERKHDIAVRREGRKEEDVQYCKKGGREGEEGKRGREGRGGKREEGDQYVA